MTSPVDASFEEERVRAVNLISKEKLPTLFVEGGLDKYVLNHHFKNTARVAIPKKEALKGQKATKGGKSLVKEKVESDKNSFGFVDMDHDFRSSFVKSNRRLEDSSPKSCLASLILDEKNTKEFTMNILKPRGISTERDVENVVKLAKAHSVVIWDRGMAGEKGFKIPALNEDDLWNRLLSSIEIEEFTEMLAGLPNGTSLRLFWEANKQFLVLAGMRDHSLVEAIVRYVESKESSEWTTGAERIKQNLAGFVKYRPLNEKLVRFRESIQTQTLRV